MSGPTEMAIMVCVHTAQQDLNHTQFSPQSLRKGYGVNGDPKCYSVKIFFFLMLDIFLGVICFIFMIWCVRLILMWPRALCSSDEQNKSMKACGNCIHHKVSVKYFSYNLDNQSVLITSLHFFCSYLLICRMSSCNREALLVTKSFLGDFFFS